MPAYKKDVHRRIAKEDVQDMMDRTENMEHRCILALLYRTGARSIELCLLRTDDVELQADGKIVIRLKTAKNGVDRNLYVPADKPFMEHVMAWKAVRPVGDFLLTTRRSATIKNIVYKASEGTLTPYTFRHNRMTRLAEAGAKPFDLMVWKGAKDFKSIQPYLYRNPETLKEVDDGD